MAARPIQVARIALAASLVALSLNGCASGSRQGASSPTVPLRIQRTITVRSNLLPSQQALDCSLTLDASFSRDSSQRLSIDATVTNAGPATFSLVDPAVEVVLTTSDGRSLYSDLGFREQPKGGYSPTFGSRELKPGHSFHDRFVTAALGGSSAATITVEGGPSIRIPWSQVPLISP